MQRILNPIAALLIVWAISLPLSAAEKKVFILAGQSNAVGFGSNAVHLPPDLTAPQGDVLFWFEEGPWDSVTNPAKRIQSNGWIPLHFQTDSQYGTFGGVVNGFGPEIKMGRLLADTLGGEVAVVKFAINATSLAHDWNAATPGPLYGDLTGIVNTAMTELSNLGHTGTIAGFFWMQGEWDARNGTDAAAYEANLTAFIQQVRSDLSEPELPFVFGRLNAEIHQSPYGISQANLAMVRAAQESVAAAMPDTSMVDTDDLDLIGDFIHFHATGQLQMGYRFGLAHLAMTASQSMNFTDLDTVDLYPGDSVLHSVTGPPGALYAVFLSLGGGPIHSMNGTMGLDLPIFFLWSSSLNSFGYHTVQIEMPDLGMGAINFYTHAAVNDPPPGWTVGGNNPNGSGSILWGLN